ncbi:helix-turn-helix transcriptional regulator [Massilia sp. 9096]|uniref:helix-turn-helix transcriptional regulator n=1 Tax=Massilia sp. 9096 TaxID=1500894 RepID=UPI000691E1C9|nr:helix-turn-helix transcriptional regulator [Massilia sp. 9096]
MFKVDIRPHWEIRFNGDPPLDTATLLGLLLGIHDSGSIADAARSVGLSYRYAWGVLREAEALFGEPLLETGRGRGTRLTPLAEKLAWADRRIAARLSPTLASLASELERELDKVRTHGREAGRDDNLHTIRIDASHGFAVAALTDYLAQLAPPGKIPLALRYRSSQEAVAALARRECDLAGFHVPLGEFEARAANWYLRWLDPRQHCLVHLAARDLGLLVARDNPLRVQGLDDLVRPELRFVNRQAGSGTRMLLELMLAARGIGQDAINGWNNAELTHSAVAAYIASGMADVGVGMRTAAEHFKLEFIPLARERYFFALRNDALQDPLMARVLAILRSADFHARVAALPGYDAAQTGRIDELDQAFNAPPDNQDDAEAP